MEKETFATTLLGGDYLEHGIINSHMKSFFGTATYQQISHIPVSGAYDIKAKFIDSKINMDYYADIVKGNNGDISAVFWKREKDEVPICEMMMMQLTSNHHKIESQQIKYWKEQELYQLTKLKGKIRDDFIYDEYSYTSCCYQQKQLESFFSKKMSLSTILENCEIILAMMPNSMDKQHIFIEKETKGKKLVYQRGDDQNYAIVQQIDITNITNLIQTLQKKTENKTEKVYQKSRF